MVVVVVVVEINLGLQPTSSANMRMILLSGIPNLFYFINLICILLYIY